MGLNLRVTRNINLKRELDGMYSIKMLGWVNLMAVELNSLNCNLAFVSTCTNEMKKMNILI